MTLTFLLASYNILANSYVNSTWYPQVDPKVLQWERRKFALAEKIGSFEADVVCLQEVEQDAYSLIERSLGTKGYTGIFAKKAMGKPDGCAIFSRHGMLRFVSGEAVYYSDGSPGILRSGHLALIASFESDSGIIKIAVTHLKWEREDQPPEECIGYRQIKELIDNHVKTDHTTYAWVICGDLNAQPDNPIVKELIINGFEDAYAGAAQATCNPNGKAKRIDYIFHTA